MSDPTTERAKGFNFAMYPTEHAEILRRMTEKRYRTPFDVVRSWAPKDAKLRKPRVRE